MNSSIPLISKVVEGGEPEFTQYSSKFSNRLKARVKKAASKSNIQFKMIPQGDGSTFKLFLEKGKEDQFWAVF